MNTSQPTMVERRARIFRFGNYPAKRWGITRAEFIAANGETGTIPIGLDPIGKGHYVGKSSVFDGKTGAATFSIEGDWVIADLRWPPLVDEAAREHGLKFSGEFTPFEKKLFQVNLVEKPHIPDAVLFAEENGHVLVFEDDEPEPPITFCQEDVEDLAQQIHEIVADHHPGFCDPSIPIEDGGNPTLREALHQLKLVHDECVQNGAYCPGMETERDDPEEVTMSDDEIQELQDENDRLKAQLAAVPKPVTFAEETPREKAMREQLEAMAAERIEEKAIVFANSVTTGAKAVATPAERPFIIEQYKRLAEDDGKAPAAVTFSEGNETRQGSRLDAYKASFKVRPRTNVPDPKAVTITLSEEPDTGMTEEAEKAKKADREERRKRNQAPILKANK